MQQTYPITFIIHRVCISSHFIFICSLSRELMSIRVNWNEKCRSFSALSHIPHRDVISLLNFLRPKSFPNRFSSDFSCCFCRISASLMRKVMKFRKVFSISCFCFALPLAIRLDDVWNSKIKTMFRSSRPKRAKIQIIFSVSLVCSEF